MQKKSLITYLSDKFSIDNISDISLNGLQVDNSKEEISRIAFAVDACLESIEKAAEKKADMLFVHHGLFWGKPVAVTGSHYNRIKALIKDDIALFAVHLPLDLHPELGNNAVMAKALSLKDIKPFGEYRGQKVGFKGRLSAPLTTKECAEKLGFSEKEDMKILDFGKKKNVTVGIISGGAAEDVSQAASEEIDLFITGEHAHAVYHFAEENRINMLCGGHYRSETFGVKAVAEHLKSKFDIETFFIDIPTGM